MSAPAQPAASFSSVDEAMDLVRAGLGYLAQQDVASLPTVTQARLLRELERAESQHTAARARVLSVFDGQWGFRDDGHGGPHPWLTWQTRVTGKAASGAVGWMRRLQAHPVVGDALAAGTVSASYARKICEWAGMLPVMLRDAGAQILVDAAAGGAGLDDLSGMAEDMFSRCAPPDSDSDREQARFGDRFFRLTRLFQGHGRADGDLTPECLAALTEVLDTLGKKAGPEDRRSAGQRGHDALEEAMRLLLASGCLPERAGQPAQVQLHLGLDELLSMPGAAQAARAWLEAHLGTPPAPAADPPAADPPAGDQPGGDPPASEPGVAEQPGGEPGSGDPPGGEPGGGDPSASERGVADQAEGEPGGGDPPGGEPSGEGGPGPGSARPGEGSPFWPDPQDLFSWPDPRAARRFAAGTGEPGWLTGKAAEAYSCDAKIAPMVCGHLDRNALARAVTAFLAGDLANLVTDADPAPVPGPRCQCDEHPAPRRAPIPGALPSTSQPGQPAASRDSLTPGGLARLQDTLLRYAVSLLSGPAGPRRLPADPAHQRVLPLTQPPARPRRAHRASPPAPAPRRDQARPALSFPRLRRPARPLPRASPDPPVQRRPDAPGQPDAALPLPPSGGHPPVGLEPDPARRRHHHRQKPRRDQDPPQPRTATRPGHLVG